MSLPSNAGWGITVRSLHSAAQIIGGLRLLLLPHLPHYLEASLKPVWAGVSTDVLPSGDEVILDFRKLALVYRSAAGLETQISLVGQTQAGANLALLKLIPLDILKGVADSAILDTFTAAIRANRPELPEHHTHFSNTEPLVLDSDAATNYADALNLAFTGLAQFRARLTGHFTPFVVWMEGFDFSGLLYTDGAMDDQKAQMNFGFAPFSRGIEEAYFYTTLYPYPEGVEQPALPAGAHWNTTGWRGVVIPYSAIPDTEDPVQFIEKTALAVYNTLRPLLGA